MAGTARLAAVKYTPSGRVVASSRETAREAAGRGSGGGDKQKRGAVPDSVGDTIANSGPRSRWTKGGVMLQAALGYIVGQLITAAFFIWWISRPVTECDCGAKMGTCERCADDRRI